MNTPMDNMMRPMNPHENPHKGQYASELPYVSETHANMNPGSKVMIGPSHKLGHTQFVGHKVIKSTLRTERIEEHGPMVDVTKNYSRLPKSMNQPQPNDAGQPVADKLYQKAAKAGEAKGGIRYGKR